MSVASFIACVRAGKVPTRSELLDAADAIAFGEQACAELVARSEAAEAELAEYKGVFRFVAEAVYSRSDTVSPGLIRGHLDKYEPRWQADALRYSPPIASAERLPPETGWVHPVGKR